MALSMAFTAPPPQIYQQQPVVPQVSPATSLQTTNHAKMNSQFHPIFQNHQQNQHPHNHQPLTHNQFQHQYAQPSFPGQQQQQLYNIGHEFQYQPPQHLQPPPPQSQLQIHQAHHLHQQQPPQQQTYPQQRAHPHPQQHPQQQQPQQQQLTSPETPAQRIQPQGPANCNMIWKNKIYLGNAATAETPEMLKKQGVTHILNMALEMPTHYNEPSHPFTYKQLPLRDDENEDISPYLPHAYYYIEEALQAGGAVFCHCHMGISRGPTAVVYYMMIKKDWSFEKALTYVKERRPKVWPNFGYAAGVLHFVYTGAGPSENSPVRVPLSIVLDEMEFVAKTYIGPTSRNEIERCFIQNGLHIDRALRALRRKAQGGQSAAVNATNVHPSPVAPVDQTANGERRKRGFLGFLKKKSN